MISICGQSYVPDPCGSTWGTLVWSRSQPGPLRVGNAFCHHPRVTGSPVPILCSLSFLPNTPASSPVLTKRTAYFPALWPLCSPAAARAGSPPFSRQTLSLPTPAGSRLPWSSAPPTLCFLFTAPSNLPVAAAYVGNLYSRLKCKSMIEENNYFCFYCLPNTRSST